MRWEHKRNSRKWLLYLNILGKEQLFGTIYQEGSKKFKLNYVPDFHSNTFVGWDLRTMKKVMLKNIKKRWDKIFN